MGESRGRKRWGWGGGKVGHSRSSGKTEGMRAIWGAAHIQVVDSNEQLFRTGESREYLFESR